MNIVLIGFMGSGKSAVGHQLAAELGLKFLDCDALVEKTAALPISRIFAEKGEGHFRTLETEVLSTLLDYDDFVIATGGGMVLKEENVALLKELGPLVLLWADPEKIHERIRHQTHRPLLQVADPKTEIRRLLKERKPYYDRAADLKVDTTRRSVEEAAKEIMEWLRSR